VSARYLRPDFCFGVADTVKPSLYAGSASVAPKYRRHEDGARANAMKRDSYRGTDR